VGLRLYEELQAGGTLIIERKTPVKRKLKPSPMKPSSAKRSPSAEAAAATSTSSSSVSSNHELTLEVLAMYHSELQSFITVSTVLLASCAAFDAPY
jgi:hypothetical protein